MPRKKTVKTGKEIFAENNIPIRECEQCGATPAAFRNYAENKILCNECKAPYLRAYLKRLAAGGAVLIVGLLLWQII